MPIEQQQSGSLEPATQVFAKITTDEPTMPAATPVTPTSAIPATPVTPTPATSAASRQSKSLTRRLARRILGPTLMTKK